MQFGDSGETQTWKPTWVGLLKVLFCREWKRTAGRVKKKSSGKVPNAARSASNHLQAAKPTPVLPGAWDWVAHNHDANLRDKSYALPALGSKGTDSWKELCVSLEPCTKCPSSLSSDGEGKRTSKVGGCQWLPGHRVGGLPEQGW